MMVRWSSDPQRGCSQTAIQTARVSEVNDQQGQSMGLQPAQENIFDLKKPVQMKSKKCSVHLAPKSIHTGFQHIANESVS